MKLTSRTLLFVTLSPIALLAPAHAQANPAAAQTPQAQAETGAPEQDIIVTGTRRSDRTVADSPVPVDVISSDGERVGKLDQVGTVGKANTGGKEADWRQELGGSILSKQRGDEEPVAHVADHVGHRHRAGDQPGQADAEHRPIAEPGEGPHRLARRPARVPANCCPNTTAKRSSVAVTRTWVASGAGVAPLPAP